MKTAIGFLLCIVAFCFLPTIRVGAQDRTLPLDKFPKPLFAPYVLDQPLSDLAPRYRIPGKKASQYTAEDWGKLIDSTWGPGQGATAQLNVFDTFWSMIDQQWAGFPNLPINWDSLRTVYRPQIGSGLSAEAPKLLIALLGDPPRLVVDSLRTAASGTGLAP